MGAPGARSEASTQGPCRSAAAPRGRHRLQNFVTGATTEGFAYDALLRTTELRRNGATVELYLRDDLSDNIAAVSNGTPGLAGMRRRIIWDGVDHPLWMFDADRGVTVYFELDTTGNVRRLHAGERITGNGSFTGDLGGYSYTAFGRNIPAAEPGGEATPKIDAVDYVQRLQWQGRWLYNRSGGLYDFRARFWSPQLGAFLQLDRYQFLSSGGTLWSWPGQNPFKYGDPSGRDAEEWFLRNGNDLAAGVGAVAVAPLALYTLASWGAVAAGDWALASSAGTALRGYSAAVGLWAGGKAAIDAAARKDWFGTGVALGGALAGAGVIGEGLGSGPRVNCPTGGSNATRAGVKRTNPADWRQLRDAWDEAGLDDILSPANRDSIAKGQTPVVDDAWVGHFPGDAPLMGEKIPMHHVGGGPIRVPLPASRHLDAHMPGGFRYNPGGPGTSG